MSDESYKKGKSLREFVDAAYINSKATEQVKNTLFKKLDEINMAFVYLNSLLDFSNNWFPVFFVLRAHSSFLAAATLSISTQLPDSYGAMRSVLECALSGFYLWKHDELIEPWLRRHENEDTRRKVRREFSHAKMIRELKAASKNLGEKCESLYIDTIDYGAHPNVGSVLPNLEQIKNEAAITHVMKYFNADSPYLDVALKQLCRIGVMALHIYGIIWNDRLKITDFYQMMSKLQAGL